MSGRNKNTRRARFLRAAAKDELRELGSSPCAGALPLVEAAQLDHRTLPIRQRPVPRHSVDIVPADPDRCPETVPRDRSLPSPFVATRVPQANGEGQHSDPLREEATKLLSRFPWPHLLAELLRPAGAPRAQPMSRS